MLACPNCGRENADNFNFCLDCGYDLKTYREAQATVESDLRPTEALSAEEILKVQANNVAPVPAALTAPEQPAMAVTTTAPSSTPMPSPAAPAPVIASSTNVAHAAAPTPAPLAPPTPPAVAAPVAAPVDVSGTCPSCQTPNPAGNKFCGKCGTKLDANAPPAPPPDGGAGRTMFMHAADLKSVVVEKTCKLIAIDPSGQEGMTFSLRTGETLCGRVNGIVLFDDPFVSPLHCAFNFTGGALTVVDKQSLNGVYRRIAGEYQLQDGDHIRVGRQLFRFESMASAAIELAPPEGDDATVWGSPHPSPFGRLVQILDDGRTGEIRFLHGDACNLGREQGQIVFPTDGFISGRHCSFYVVNKEARVKDLGSSNGTYVRIRGTASINHGEFILVGNQMLRVEIV